VKVTGGPNVTLYKNGVVSVGGMTQLTEDSQFDEEPILESIGDFQRTSVGESFALQSFDGD
jgi:hypothetical protein